MLMLILHASLRNTSQNMAIGTALWMLARLANLSWGSCPNFISGTSGLRGHILMSPSEHFVGNHTRLAAAALHPWQVLATVCKKYQIGKRLQFLHMC